MNLKAFARGIAVASGMVAGAVAAQEEPVAQVPVQVKTEPEARNDNTMTRTDGGITVETMDGRASFKLDGRLQFDTMFFNGIYNDPLGGVGASDTRVRRMRLAVSGDLDRNWQWVWSMDVNNERNQARLDAFYIVYTGFEPLDITVGKFKRPFLLEALTSSKWITFNERSLVYDIANSHVADFGVMLSKIYDVGEKGKISWYAEMLNEGVEDYGAAEQPAGRDQWSYFARGAWAPWVEKDHVLHFGLGLGDMNPATGGEISVSSRLGVAAASSVGVNYTVEEDREVGVEAAWIFGPFSAQAEYVARNLHLAGNDSALVSGAYAQFTYTLTGESRVYKPYPARMDKIKPSGEHGFGAVELVARADFADLEQPGQDSATANNITVGANWYVNPHLLFKLNYTHTEADNFGTFEEDGDAILIRTAFVF